MSRRRLIVATTILAVLACTAYSRVTGQSAAAIKIIPQPATWVAFEADVRISSRGEPVLVGHFYRNSDGSTRLETGPEEDPARVVSIKNIAESAYYAKRPVSGKWLRGPMKLPSGGWVPMAKRADVPGRRQLLRKYAVQADGVLTESADGLELYEFNNDRVVSYEAPSLNCFRVLEQDLITGRRQFYFNIRIGEPRADLFVPPTGATIEHTTRLGGIVSSKSS